MSITTNSNKSGIIMRKYLKSTRKKKNNFIQVWYIFRSVFGMFTFWLYFGYWNHWIDICKSYNVGTSAFPFHNVVEGKSIILQLSVLLVFSFSTFFLLWEDAKLKQNFVFSLIIQTKIRIPLLNAKIFSS